MKMEKQHLIKNEKSTDFTDLTRMTYHTIKAIFSYRARITQIIEMLRVSFGIDEFQIYDPRLMRNGEFNSYLLDFQQDFMAGKDVDFTELYEAIIKAGDFLSSERRLFELGNVEERLWGILLAIRDQEIVHKI